MNQRLRITHLFPYVYLLFLAIPVLGYQAVKLQRGQSIHVVCIKDSRLLTFCPAQETIVHPHSQIPDRSKVHVIMFPNGSQSIRIPETYSNDPYRIYDVGALREERTARIQYLTQIVELPSPASYARNEDWVVIDRVSPDPDLKAKVEKEFLSQKRYALVDSPEKADFVFLVEGYYGAVGSWSQGSVGVIHRNLDERPNILRAALAIAVPSGIYRRHIGHGSSLLGAKIWEGSVISRRLPPRRRMIEAAEPANSFEIRPASVESLVKQFHNKEKRPTVHPPVCAATDGILRLHAGLESNEEPASRPVLKGKPAPPPPGSAATERNDGFQADPIKADVSLVAVPVFVSGGDGKSLSDLKISDIRVFEDDVEQKIDRLIQAGEPYSIALMVDTSASMYGSEALLHTIGNFVTSMRSEDQLNLVAFDTRIRVFPEFTKSPSTPQLQGILLGRSSGTRLYDAIDLVRTSYLDKVSGRRAIVLLTDGVDTQSRLADSVSTLKGIEEDNILFYVIQYETKENASISRLLEKAIVFPKSKTGWISWLTPEVDFTQDQRYERANKYLLDLSKGSGGDIFLASTNHEVQAMLSCIAAELGHEYTICYYPSNVARDGSYRRIHVTVDIPGTKVRARQGYRAGTASEVPKSK